MSQSEHFMSYLRRIDHTRTETENLIRIIGEVQEKNRRLYKDNVRLEHALKDVLDKPEVQVIIKRDQAETESWINKFVDECIAQAEIKKQVRDQNKQPVEES